MNTLTKIRTAKKNGILYPYRAHRAAKNAGIPFWVMCAFLEQESSGGMNVFGHDNSIFAGAGEVTKKKYLLYKSERDRKSYRRMQGVGPMQLTWWEYQDLADHQGGCWNIYVNMLTGAEILRGHYEVGKTYRDTEIGRWRYAAYKYNGAQSYVDSIAPKFDKWRGLLT